MSGRLTIEVVTESLDEARVDLVVVYFFESDRPMRGAAGRADWRLCGQFSRLLLSEKLTGAAGEAVLVATGPGWTAPRVLGVGLGARRVFDGRQWEALARDTLGPALRLRVETVAVPISDPEFGNLATRERIGAFLRGSVAAVALDSARLRLQLVVPEADANPAQEAVTQFAARNTQSAVVLAIQAAHPLRTPRRAPHGGEPPERRSTQIFK